MTKLTLDKEVFKILASETRLQILRSLDGKKLTLAELSTVISMNKATLHEHLGKLSSAGLIKRKEREGHKWVYYRLSWKGSSLLHPENNRIVVMFSATILALFAGITGLINHFRGLVLMNQDEDLIFAPGIDKSNETYTFGVREINNIGQNPFFLYISIGCIILFIILCFATISKYRKNKKQKL